MVGVPRLESAGGPDPDPVERDGPDAQPPWDLIALLGLAFIVLGWMALAVSYNPSHGAQGAFERFHTVTLEQFQTLPWREFLHQMHTTYGPVFYALVGSLHLPLQGVRAVGLVMHLLSTLLIFQVVLGFGMSWTRATMLAAAFFASPFQFGPALWGHPDALAMLLMLLGIAVSGLLGGAYRPAAMGLLPLTVVVHQAGVAVVAASCLDDLRTRRFVACAVKLGATGALLYLLYQVWDGFTPPSVRQTLQFNTRALLMGFTLLVLGLHAWDRINLRFAWHELLQRFLALWVVFTVVYGVSAPFAGGGFIFSRLDALQADWLPLSVLSPALMAAVVAWSWRSLLGYRLATLQILVCATMLATGDTLYLKDVDFFFWPLLLMRLVRWGRQRPGIGTALLHSAVCWTLVSLTLATLSYGVVTGLL